MTNTWGDCTAGCVAFSGVTGWTDFNLRHTTGGELWVLNWLEDSGYAVDVCTDYDFHCGKPILDVIVTTS